MVMDDFSNAPLSITEIRSDKSDSAADWTPRDALVSLLREIDKGDVSPDAIVICFRQPGEREGSSHFRMSASDPLIGLGLITRVAHLIQMSAYK